MAWDQTVDFEEGDTSDFDSVTQNGSSTFIAHADAALSGSYGGKITIDASQNTTYGTFTDPAGETLVTVSFKIDINNLTMADNESFKLAESNYAFLSVFLFKYSDGYVIRAQAKDDASSFLTTTSLPRYESGVYDVLVVWKASSGAGNDDGYVLMYLDGELHGSLTGIDNDTRSITDISIGAVFSIDAGTSGTFYMDDIKWSNDVYIPTPVAIPSMTLTSVMGSYHIDYTLTPDPVNITITPVMGSYSIVGMVYYTPTPVSITITPVMGRMVMTRRLTAPVLDFSLTAEKHDITLTAPPLDFLLIAEEP